MGLSILTKQRPLFLFVVAILCHCSIQHRHALSVEAFSFNVIAPFRRAALKTELKSACRKKDRIKILDLSEQLRTLNPTTDIQKEFNKLDGDWKLDFTTASAREVPPDDDSTSSSTTTGFKTFQTIDTKKGIIYNIIDRGLPKKGLKVAVGAEPTRP